MRSFDIPARQARDSSDNDGDPGVTDCHLFLAISPPLSLFDRESWSRAANVASFSHFKFKYGKSQDDKSVTLRLENWRARIPPRPGSI